MRLRYIVLVALALALALTLSKGAVATAGAAVRWLRDGLGMIKSASEIEDLVCPDCNPNLTCTRPGRLTQLMVSSLYQHSQGC